jgi:hypothetical protein
MLLIMRAYRKHLSRQSPGYFGPIELAQGSSIGDTASERRHYLRIVD